MKRKELLSAMLSEDKNVDMVVSNAIKADTKFIKRSKRQMEDQIEDLEERLSSRLSSETPIDKSVVESTYAELIAAKDLLRMYETFEKEYLN